MVEWFEHIADASEELREEFDNMVASGGTPRDFGLKVKSHPVLMITSPLKMRTAKSLWLSFSGSVVETISLFKEQQTLKRNYDAFERLSDRAGSPASIPKKVRGDKVERWKGAIWYGVPAEQIIEFLQDYKTHSQARKVNSLLLADFIQRMNRVDELTEWTIAVIGGGTNKYSCINGIKIPWMERKVTESADHYAIGRLLSPRDEGIDCEEEVWLAALEETRERAKKTPEREPPAYPSGVILRRMRGTGVGSAPSQCKKGLLLIYLLDSDKSRMKFENHELPVVAFGISFPGSNSSVTVEYKVNNVLWEQEYGATE